MNRFSKISVFRQTVGDVAFEDRFGNRILHIIECHGPLHIWPSIYRGSNRSVHVLLYVLHELEKRGKIRDLSSILSLFSIKINKQNNTGARMIGSMYHVIEIY